jgi:amidase
MVGMDTTAFTGLDATEIAELVRTGRATAVDVVRSHLDLVAQRDPGLNAFQDVYGDRALADAAELDARSDRSELPLAGVPLAIKVNMGLDDELVRRMRAAGCVVLGRTRMPELAIWGFTSSDAFGPTRNPRDPSLDPGGSSGGSAVAVASGMAALALGTDGGGSLRIPAAHTGVVGLKPTAGIVPLPEDLSEHWCGLTVAGPLARTVRDARAAFEVLGGRPVPDQPTGSLRVAVSLRSPSPIGRPDARQREAVTLAADALRGLGHDVRDKNPPYPMTILNRWTRRWWAGIAQDVDRLGLDPDSLEPRTRTMVGKGRKVLRRGPKESEATSWRDAVARWFEDVDVVAMPAVARGPIRAGQYDGVGYGRTFLYAARTTPFTPAWNLAGNPAIVVPVGTRDGLPLTVQLAGPAGSESRLLSVAAALEARG